MFDSPAAILILLSGSWFFLVPPPGGADTSTLTFSYMADTRNYGKYGDFSLATDKSIFDVSYQLPPTRFLGLRLGVSGMYDIQGTYMFGPGFGKTVEVGKFDTTLFIYPSYSSIHGLDSATTSGTFNWRTTFDVLYRVSDKMKAGLGVMHISNGGYREPNHGIEAVRLTVEYTFR